MCPSLAFVAIVEKNSVTIAICVAPIRTLTSPLLRLSAASPCGTKSTVFGCLLRSFENRELSVRLRSSSSLDARNSRGRMNCCAQVGAGEHFSGLWLILADVFGNGWLSQWVLVNFERGCDEMGVVIQRPVARLPSWRTTRRLLTAWRHSSSIVTVWCLLCLVNLQRDSGVCCWMLLNN